MGYFGLELQEDKSRLIKFGRLAGQDAKEKGRKAETKETLGRPPLEVNVVQLADLQCALPGVSRQESLIGAVQAIG